MSGGTSPAVAHGIDALPSLALRVAAAGLGASDPHGLPEAERLVMADQSLAAMVLRVANSPLYGQGGSVAAVDTALRMLGSAVVRRIAAGLAALAPGTGVDGFDRPRFLEHSVASGAGCRALARRLGCAPPEEAHAAGLLHSLGQAVFLQGNPRKYGEVVRRAAEEVRPLVEVEREVFGTDHGRAGSIVAERWNLPARLRDVIAHHHSGAEALEHLPAEGRALVEVVVAVDAILGGQGLSTCCRNGKAILPVGGRAVAEEDAEAVVEAARDALQEASVLMGLPEGEESGGADGFLDRVRRAERALEAGTRGAAPPLPARPDLAATALAVAESIREMRALPTAEEAWRTALRGIRHALAVDRVLFYAYDAERARLDLRHGLDDTGLIHGGQTGVSDLPLAPAGALAHAVRDGRPVLVDDLGADEEFLRGLGVSRVAAAPVDILEKTHGVVTVDNIFSGRPLDATDASLLGLLASEVGLAIENLLLHKQTQKLRSLAERDELTGVNNRRNLMALFQRELDRARRYGSVLSVAMVDIDFFKSFNDTYGHQAGDEVLRTISQVLVAASREIDIIGRYGGEEFVALLPETNLKQASVYAERLRSRVEMRGQDLRTRFPKTRPLTISVGITQAVPAAGDDVERVIARVDAALYEAKEKGRNRVVVAEVSGSE